MKTNYLYTYFDRLILLFGFLALSGVSTGCANLRIGRPINTALVGEIRPAYTTKHDITNMFGLPLRQIPGAEGDIWIYRYLTGTQRPPQELIVTFHENLVSTYSCR